MGGGKGGSSTTVEIPDELKPIYQKLGQQWSQAMDQHPFMGPEAWFGAGQNQWNLDPTWGTAAMWQAPHGRLPAEYSNVSNQIGGLPLGNPVGIGGGELSGLLGQMAGERRQLTLPKKKREG